MGLVTGDIRAFCTKPDAKPWRLGMQNPWRGGKDDKIVGTTELEDMAISI